MVNIQKAAIIGCGFVGASSAFSLLQKGIAPDENICGIL